MTATVAIVPAVFAAEAADQALADLGGETAIERVVRTCVAAGVSQVLVLRRTDAAPLEGVHRPGGNLLFNAELTTTPSSAISLEAL